MPTAARIPARPAGAVLNVSTETLRTVLADVTATFITDTLTLGQPALMPSYLNALKPVLTSPVKNVMEVIDGDGSLTISTRGNISQLDRDKA